MGWFNHQLDKDVHFEEHHFFLEKVAAAVLARLRRERGEELSNEEALERLLQERVGWWKSI